MRTFTSRSTSTSWTRGDVAQRRLNMGIPVSEIARYVNADIGFMIGPMRDYWLSKLFYDLQSPGAAAEYRAERDKVLDRYRIGAEVRKALAENDVPFLAQRTNAYLLRYYFFATGMKDEEFMRRLRHG